MLRSPLVSIRRWWIPIPGLVDSPAVSMGSPRVKIATAIDGCSPRPDINANDRRTAIQATSSTTRTAVDVRRRRVGIATGC
jgi:hypothetical protein